MDRDATLILLAASTILLFVASLGDRSRRARPLAWHAHLPWHGLAFLGVTGVLLAAAHLISLFRGGGL